MNVGNEARLEGFNVLLETDGRDFDILDGPSGLGGTVTGILAVVPPVDPSMELGPDIREMACLEVLNPAPSNLLMDVELREKDTLNKWRIVKRENNTADFTSKYWVVAVTNKDT